MPEVDAEQQVMLNLLVTAMRAVRAARVRHDDEVFIIGHGVRATACRIALEDQQLRPTVLPDATSLASARPASVVFDVTGRSALVREILEQVPRWSRVVLLAPSVGLSTDVDFYRTVHQKGLDVIGISDARFSDHGREDAEYRADLAEAMRLVGDHRLTDREAPVEDIATESR